MTFWASRWRLPLLWSAVILVLTSWPSPRIGIEVSGGDKIVHFAMYGILGFLVTRALALPRKPVELLAVLAWITVFALLDEVHQHWIPGREASVADWTADLLGATAGLLLANHILSSARERPGLLT